MHASDTHTVHIVLFKVKRGNFVIFYKSFLKGSVQWKNDLGLYCSLVLVMNIGMCDLVILCLVYPLQEF